MLKIKIFSIGKTREKWLEDAIEEYTIRLKPILTCEWILAKNDSDLTQLVTKENRVICLDPKGKLMTSEEFAAFVQTNVEEGGSRLSFVIGGADGLPDSLKKNHPLLSLSPLTFTHQLTRLILIEQLYRSFEILKGSPYHK